METHEAPGNRAGSRNKEDFDLGAFFPYLVRIYYRAVSSSVEDIYTSLFGLTRPEWRTMAVLGPYRALSAGEIVEQSSMNKVHVSRAIARLHKRGFLKRDINGDDRRRVVLRLTGKGREVFGVLVPKLLELEEKLLEGLTPHERQMLVSLMEKVRNNTK